MKRALLTLRRGDSGCCPGHDTFPTGTYANRRSKKARRRDRQIENQLVRTLQRRALRQEMEGARD